VVSLRNLYWFPTLPDQPAILFVCLGNICRSPLAEAAMRAELAAAGLEWTVDSAGTGDWHIGRPPDPRARTEAKRRGHAIDHYQARQVTRADFTRFSHIVALDRNNLADLHALAPRGTTAQLSLLLDHVPARAGESVTDPYYGDAADFAVTWEEVSAGAKGLLGSLS
jgi:protein-tyrosine phosphatase